MSRFVDFYLIGELVDSHGNVHYEDLKRLPTADVVEVVRCKDCKHADEYHHCDKVAWWNNEDDFCSKGERK